MVDKGYTERDLNIAVVGGGVVGHVIATGFHAEGHNVIMFDGQKSPGASRACTGIVDIEQAGDDVMLLLHKLYPSMTTRLVKVNDSMRMYAHIDKDDIFRAFPSDRKIRRDALPFNRREARLNFGDAEQSFDVLIYCLGAYTNKIFENLEFQTPGKIYTAYTGKLAHTESDCITLEDKYQEFRVRNNLGFSRVSSISFGTTKREFPSVYELDTVPVQNKPLFINLGRDVWSCSGTGTNGIYYAARWYLQISATYKDGWTKHDLVDN